MLMSAKEHEMHHRRPALMLIERIIASPRI
jgi:hypothetical protein